MARPILREGTSVSLGILERGDVLQIYRGLNSPEVSRFLPRRGHPTSLEEEYGRYDSLRSDGPVRNLAVSVNSLRGKPKSDLAGTISLTLLPDALGTAQVECALFRQYWGYGYAREALALAASYAFGVLNLRKLIAHVLAPNAQAIRVLEANGFSAGVRLKSQAYVEGMGYVDELIYELERKRKARGR